MSLADENTGVMNRFGKTELVDTSLEAGRTISMAFSQDVLGPQESASSDDVCQELGSLANIENRAKEDIPAL